MTVTPWLSRVVTLTVFSAPLRSRTTVTGWPALVARTAACTDAQALDLDRQQYASGRGPCLEAAWQGRPLRAIIGEEHQRWPEFVEAAQRQGIRASLSVPLLIVGIDGLGDPGGAVRGAAEIAAALVFGVIFVRRQIRLPAPLLPVDLLRIRAFALSMASSVCAFITARLEVAA